MVAVARIRMPENGVFQCRVPPALTLLPGDRCMVEWITAGYRTFCSVSGKRRVLER